MTFDLRRRLVAGARPRRPAANPPPLGSAAPTLDVVVPVYNEERDLEPSVKRLRTYLDEHLPFDARITIADNASTDETWAIAQRLERDLPAVRALHLPQKGRGRALRAAWLASDAEVVAYMDVDLSTGLDALLPLVAPLLSGHSEVAIGSRLARGSHVVRGSKREFISRTYNLILRSVLRVRFSDAQCGFKAIRADVARRLVPIVEDEAWFFDTELLVLAERAGLRIHEVPVDWVDDTDSRVALVSTATADLRGVWRLLRSARRLALPGLPRRNEVATGIMDQVRSFATIGVLSTLAYGAIYSLLRTFAPPVAANAIALLTTAIGNTAANRRLTFGVRDKASILRDQAAGLAAFAIALAITTGAVSLLGAVAPDADRTVELAVLLVASVLATVARFALLRAWIFPARTAAFSATTDHLQGTLS